MIKQLISRYLRRNHTQPSHWRPNTHGMKGHEYQPIPYIYPVGRVHPAHERGIPPNLWQADYYGLMLNGQHTRDRYSPYFESQAEAQHWVEEQFTAQYKSPENAHKVIQQACLAKQRPTQNDLLAISPQT